MTESWSIRRSLSIAIALCACASPVLAQQGEPLPAADVALAERGVAADSALVLSPMLVAGIPDDAQLQASGARIGRIDIKVIDVFDPENPKESGTLYRVANFLHIDTREATVRPQLLFKPGEPYSRHALDETERNLRARRYMEDASITPVAYHADTNTVDLLVRVHDVWTLNPGASYGHSGGESSSGAQISESNLLGWGKSISVARTRDVDRSAWKFAYNDPNLLSTRWELAAAYSDTSDGGARALKVTHPFYSLNTRWSAALETANEERMDQRFEQGVAVDQYFVEQKSLGVQGGWSTGLRGGDDNHPAWIQRWSLGYRIDERTYRPDPVLGTLVLPEDSHLRYPWLGLSWFQDSYVVTRNRDQIMRTEDLYMGRSFKIRLGYAAKSSGSDSNATLLGMAFQDAFRLGERQFMFANLGIDGRRESGRWQGTTFTAGLRYDLRETAKSMLMVSLNHAHVENMDESQQLFLGSDEGMRGYPLRYRSGTERSVLVVEQRVYTDKQILRLLSVAGAAFVDVGDIRGQTTASPDGRHTFTDVGFGLRLGNIRSSRGDIFHFDVAYPLNATGDDRKLQFSVVTKSSF